MHRIGGAKHARQAAFAYQRLHRRNFVALHHDADVPEDNLGAHGERPKQLGDLRVIGGIVAAFQALAVIRDHLALAAEAAWCIAACRRNTASNVPPSTRPMILYRVDETGARCIFDGKAAWSSAKRSSMKEHWVL